MHEAATTSVSVFHAFINQPDDLDRLYSHPISTVTGIPVQDRKEVTSVPEIAAVDESELQAIAHEYAINATIRKKRGNNEGEGGVINRSSIEFKTDQALELRGGTANEKADTTLSAPAL